MAPMLDTGCSILDFLIQNPESSIEYLGTRALGLRHHQPARKLVLELACEINTELRACIQTQRVAVCAIEQQSDRAPARRAGKDPAHLSQFIPCCGRRELQEHRGFLVCRSFSRAVALSGRKRLDLLCHGPRYFIPPIQSSLYFNNTSCLQCA